MNRFAIVLLLPATLALSASQDQPAAPTSKAGPPQQEVAVEPQREGQSQTAVEVALDKAAQGITPTPKRETVIPVVNVKTYGKYNPDFMPAATGTFENAEAFTSVQAITESDTDSKEDVMASINLGVELLRKEARIHGADGLQNLRLTPLPVKKGVRFLSEADLVKFKSQNAAAISPADIIKKEGKVPQVLRLGALQSLRFGSRVYLFKDNVLVNTLEFPRDARPRPRPQATPDTASLMKAAQAQMQHEEALRQLEEQVRLDNQIHDDLRAQTEGWIRFTNPPHGWTTYPGGRILESQP